MGKFETPRGLIMTIPKYLEEADIRIESLKVRLTVATEGLTPDQLNSRTPEHDWPMLGLAWHLCASMSSYWPPMEEALEKAPSDTGRLVRFTFVGSLLHKAVGPSGSASVPRQLQPPDRRLREDLIKTLFQDLDRLQELCRRWEGKDITQSKLSSPFVKMVRISLADALEMHILHGDRHIGQMQRVADHIRRQDMIRSVT